MQVTLYDGTTEEGFHDIDNVDRVNEVFLNVNSITEMLSGENADIGKAIALAIHETTHINQVDTKDDLAEMKASGKNSAEENLAEHVEGRISDKIDTDSDKFTEEEMTEYLAGLEVKNKEKGREQKSLAEGTVEAEKVGSESKEKNAVPASGTGDPFIAIGIKASEHSVKYNTDEEYRTLVDKGIIQTINGVQVVVKEEIDKLKNNIKMVAVIGSVLSRPLLERLGFMSEYEEVGIGEAIGEEELRNSQKLGGIPLNEQGMLDKGGYSEDGIEGWHEVLEKEEHEVVILTAKEADNKDIENKEKDEKETKDSGQTVEGTGGTVFKVGSKSDALKSLTELPDDVAKNVKRFIKKSGSGYTEYSVELLENDNYQVKMLKPGDVSGYAEYYKTIDSRGTTIETYKDTFDNSGNFVHRKYK